MRLVTQAAIIAVLGAAGYGGWTYWQHQQAAVQASPAGGQRGGGPPLLVEVAPVRTGVVYEKAESIESDPAVRQKLDELQRQD